jgi:AGCS family alanine or glycine:cation symporter
MSKPAVKALKDYEKQQAEGVEKYTFDPKSLGIKNATFWEERFEKENPTKE